MCCLGKTDALLWKQWRMSAERLQNDDKQMKTMETQKEQLSGATLSSKNLTRCHSGLNTSLHGKKPAINCLGYVMTLYL
jgi:hypothetical protein